MPKSAPRNLTRVEREWADFPFQPLFDVFRLADVASEDEATQVAQGIAYTWITWYMALAKPVRRRNLGILIDRLSLSGFQQSELVRVIADNDAYAFQFLRGLTVQSVMAAWRAYSGMDAADGDDDPPPTIDWDLWTGPGAG